MKPKIIPTIFARNKRELVKRFEMMIPLSNDIQIDIMDGKFVKNKSFNIKHLPDLDKFRNSFEAHLMVAKPQKWVIKGFDRIIFHIESVNIKEARNLILELRKEGVEPVLAINPGTPLNRIKPLLNELNIVLCMGVNPGLENQKLSSSTIRKIRAIKRIMPRIHIQVDGGVNNRSIRTLARAGADRFNSGSFIAESLNPSAALETLQKEAIKGFREREFTEQKNSFY